MKGNVLELFKKGTKATVKLIEKKSPTILVIAGIAGFGVAVYLACKAVPAAEERIEDAKYENCEHPNDKLGVVKTFKAVAPVYWPAALVFAGSAACVIFGNQINLKRNAALAAAYGLAQKGLSEVENKIIESCGEKKYEEIKNSIMHDKLKEAEDEYKSKHGEYYPAPIGTNVLFLDALSGRLFFSSIENMKAIQNDLNKRLLKENYISLNELYDEIPGLPRIDMGDMLGWSCNDYDHMIEMSFRSQLTEDGKPCVVLDYEVGPTWDFRDY